MSYKPPMGDPAYLQKPIGGGGSNASNAGGGSRRSGSSARTEAKVYTGSSALMKDLVKQSEPSIKKQPGELFHRVRPTTIGAMLDRHRINEMQEGNEAGRMMEGGLLARPETLPGHEDLVGRRTAQVSSYNKNISETIRPTSSVVGGGGGASYYSPAPSSRMTTTTTNAGRGGGRGGGRVAPIEEESDPQQVPFADREVLVLDVREKEEYDQCHIVGALHYPPLRLAHATNPYSLSAIREFKNKPNHAIVLYDLDEEVTVQRKMANIFFEKGADNVYVMAGGLTAFVQTHAHLISGPSPVAVVAKSARLSAYGQDKMSSTRGSSIGRGGGGSEIAHGRRSGSIRSGVTDASSRIKGAFNRAAQPGPSTTTRAGAPPRPPQHQLGPNGANRLPPPPPSSHGAYSNTASSMGSQQRGDGNYTNCQGGRVPTPQRVQRLMQMAVTEDDLGRRGSSNSGGGDGYQQHNNGGGYDDDYYNSNPHNLQRYEDDDGGYDYEDGGGASANNGGGYGDEGNDMHLDNTASYDDEPPRQQYLHQQYRGRGGGGGGGRGGYVDY